MNKLKLISVLTVILFSSFIKVDAQTLSLNFPVGNEIFMNNTQAPHNIFWDFTDVTNVKIEYSINNGVDWIIIESSYSTSNDFYNWLTPDVISDECLIKITDVDNEAIFDISDSPFSITDTRIHIAEWNTSMGTFRAELRGDLAPVTVQNFLNLASRNFYNDLIFHRVIAGFMIQDGCPLGTGTGGPGYEFDSEISPWLNHEFPGILAMANAGPDTNGSQYYITVDETSWLDGGYSIFGKIIDGMNIVYAISEVPTNGSDKPLVDVDIYSITIVESNPTLNIVFPANEASIIQGSVANIQWESDFVADVKIEFSNDNGANWTTLSDSIAADSSNLAWIVPQEISDECLIKISDLRDNSFYIQNAFEIRIKPAVLQRIELYNNVIAHTNNEENLIMLGKNVRFKVKMLNNYTSSLDNLSATIISKDANAEIISSTVSFPATGIGEENWSTTEFEVLLSNEIPTNKEFSFEIQASDTEFPDQPWISYITIPMLEIFNFITVDTDNNGNSSGNNNGTIESGETAEISLPISNNSQKIIYHLSGQLFSPANYVNIWNNIEGYDGMVYDTTIYNDLAPINPGSSMATQSSPYVMDYTASETYQIPAIIKATGYLQDEPGANWETGGIKIKWGLERTLNPTSPSQINNVSNNNKLKIIENPVSNILKFEYNNDDNTNFNIFLYDIYGKTVYSKVKNKQISNNYYINVSKLNSGTYLLVVKSKSNSYSQKIIITN